MKSKVDRRAFLLSLFVLLCVKCDYYISGTISANTSSSYFNYSLSSGSANAATVFFRITNQVFSNLVLLVDTSPIDNLNITPQSLSKYYLQSNTILQQMDIPRVIAGYNQLISVRVPYGTISVLYFMLYNLDLPNVLTNKTYSIQITPSSIGTIYCYDCPPAAKLTLNNGACQCYPCPDNYYGAACEFYQRTLLENNNYNVSFFKAGNLYFRIVNPPKTIQLTISELTGLNITTLYMQYEIVTGAIAGPLNTYYNSNNQSFSLLVTKDAKTVSINTQGQNISLTLTCRQAANVLVQIGYFTDSDGSKSSLRLAIGLGLGIPAALIVIFVIIFSLCCRHRSTSNVPKNALVNQYLLTTQEINRYLPQVRAQLALKNTALQQSRENLAAQKEENGQREETLNQCCICLTQIVHTDTIRVGYCGHFFHSKCLLGWFAKNQSCPYCRMEFNYNLTLAAYLNIRKQGPDLTGEKLVKAILNVQMQVAEQKMKMVHEELKKQSEPNEREREREQEEEVQIQLDSSGPSNQRYHRVSQPDPIPHIEVITASLGQLQAEER